ncbi:MAG: hypothetical protein HKM97_05655 [Acidimicrobiia bacterium]|nr:hypothetical protein [Acidimicrobiia bacterium]
MIDTLPADHVFENLRGELYGNIGENKAGSVLRDVAEDWLGALEACGLIQEDE